MERPKATGEQQTVLSPENYGHIILTQELALQINTVGGKLSDDLPFYSLVAYPRTFYRPREQALDTITDPPQEWTELMETLSRRERVQVEAVMSRFSRLFRDIRTLGDVRRVLARETWISRVGPRGGKPFLETSFKKAEED